MPSQSRGLERHVSSAGDGIYLLPDSRGRSAARERACFAARRASGATKTIDEPQIQISPEDPPFLAISCASSRARSYAVDGGAET